MPSLLPAKPSNRDLTSASTMASAVGHTLDRLDTESLYVGRVETVYPTVAGVVDLFERDLIERVKEEVQIGWKYIEVADVNGERLIMTRPRST